MENTIYLTVFVILTIVIHQSIKAGLNIDGLKCWILSICVSLLAIVGMQAFLQTNVTGKDADMPTILLPYAAMGITILTALIAAWLCKILQELKKPHRNHRTKKHEEPHERRIRIHNPK